MTSIEKKWKELCQFLDGLAEVLTIGSRHDGSKNLQHLRMGWWDVRERQSFQFLVEASLTTAVLKTSWNEFVIRREDKLDSSAGGIPLVSNGSWKEVSLESIFDRLPPKLQETVLFNLDVFTPRIYNEETLKKEIE